MTDHARLSPSGAHGWMRCDRWESDPVGSSFADEGTVAHHIAAQCLLNGHDADVHTGETYGPDEISNIGTRVQVTREMAQYVQMYVDFVRDASAGHELLVEQRVSFSDIVGVPDQFGTADAIVLRDNGVLSVIDLKYGRGVKVNAVDNEQLLIYGLAALREYEPFGLEFKSLSLTVAQPRLDHIEEWVVDMPTIREFEAQLREAAARVLGDNPQYNPGDKQCRWCAAKATCPALAAKVAEDVGIDFDNLDAPAVPDDRDELAVKMSAIDLIEDWCRAVRAKVETELLAGHPVTGYKLVEGKRGARAWSDEAAAEDLLRKKFRLTIEQAYNLKLVTPTQAEKLLKDSPRRWAQLEPLISQSAGKPSVAPASDKRPEYSVAGNFTNLNEEN